jgi:chromosome partitioning protein
VENIMLSIVELAALLSLSKERVKQLVNDELALNPGVDIQTGTVWRIGPQTVRKLMAARNIRFPARKVATFASFKGGIGKTTISTNVAVRAASLGAKVLLIDLDPEACSTNQLVKSGGKDPIIFVDLFRENLDIRKAILPSSYRGLDVVPSALRNHSSEKIVAGMNPKRIVKDKLEGLDYNLILLELPPSFTTLTGSAYLAADLIVLPCIPSVYSLESVALTIEAIDSLAKEFEVPKKEFKVLMNEYNSARVASQQITKELLDTYKSMVFPFYIKESTDISNANNAGKSVFEIKCSKAIREDFHELTMQVCGVEVTQ